MIDPTILKQLRSALHSQSLLYVEDNEGLRKQATTMFEKFFETVYTASDGEAGLELFKQYHPAIVISDIRLPKMDGLEMAKAISCIDHDVKIIFATAYDEPELLHQAIRVGAFDYLIKPMNVPMLLDVLMRCAKALRCEMHQKLFTTYLHNIFDYQKSLVLLLHHDTVVMANQPCLDFFSASNVDEFKKQFFGFGDLLLEHNGFLYNHDNVEWFKETLNNPDKLFNVKIADNEGSSHHFVLNMQAIAEKKDYYVLSLNDVTELNLLKLFDAAAVEKEEVQKDKKALRGLLEMAKRNNAKIKVHNFYKGLSVTNDGIIYDLDSEYVVIKTSFIQLKAIQAEKRVVLASEIFPLFIESDDIRNIDFGRQEVTVGACFMTKTSATRRQFIRVPPNEEAIATVFFDGRKVETDITIADLSIKGTRFMMGALPPMMQVGSKVTIDMVLGSARKPLIINTEAEVFRLNHQKHNSEVVFMYDLHGQIYKSLIEFIAKQQMQLIREFRGLQYGQ